MRLTLVLTHQCDLACEYCYTGRKFDRSLDPALGRRAIDRAVAGLAPGEALELSLFGGEPLLEWPLARDLLRHAHARVARAGARLEPVMTTNGTRLDEATADEALGLGVTLAVSMDGLPEVHDAVRPRRGGQRSSDAALRAIDLLVARGAPFRVISVVRPATVDRLAAGTRFLADRGVRHFAPNLDASAPWAQDDAPRLRAAVRGLHALWVERAPGLRISWLDGKVHSLLHGAVARSCNVGVGEVAVAPSGRLYPCERLVGEDDGALAMGHVEDSEGPFAPFGGSARPGDDTACGDCATRPHCNNACACANLARTGTLDGPDGLVCVLEQACLEACLEDDARPARGRLLPLTRARPTEVTRVGT
jgi:uncharacterized protein